MSEPSAGEPHPRNRRRTILIRPAYQLRVAATILLAIATYSLLLGFLIFYPLHQEFAAAAGTERQIWVAHQVLELHHRFWPSLLLVAVLVAVQSLFVTHRIMGPAYNIEQVLKALAGAKWESRVRLRRADRLKELAAAVNVLGEALEDRERIRQERDSQLRRAVRDLRRELQEFGQPVDRMKAVAELERLTARGAAAS
ncbi:MAG TPA: hypothetical protein VMG58_04375 [Candidatus Sulfotelmatobacter sp.]|nr:hypothetical protein [Candidatus Sulfotelmatobacter sp.]